MPLRARLLCKHREAFRCAQGEGRAGPVPELRRNDDA
jgi:hypothetical protein